MFVIPEQMHTWLNGRWNAWQGVEFSTPEDLSGSPVMRYLEVLLANMLEAGGSIKLTTKGNLPLQIVQQCNALAEQLSCLGERVHITISEYQGRNEDDFNALHYTRVLAELAGILYPRSGRLHFKKAAQKKFQQQGVAGFYADMLDTATRQYNWGYLDGFPEGYPLRELWLFMLWRLQSHQSIEQLADDVKAVIGTTLKQMPAPDYGSRHQELLQVISTRFVWRFLGFFGLVKQLKGGGYSGTGWKPIEFTPLMAASFRFSV